MRGSTIPTDHTQERAFLVGVEVAGQPGLLAVEDSLAELALLAQTARLSVVGQAIQRLRKPDPKTFIGADRKSVV